MFWGGTIRFAERQCYCCRENRSGTGEYQNQIVRIKKEKAQLISALSKIKIIEKLFPSDANFLLVKVKDANFIYNILVNKNIITRNRTSVINNCIRITVGSGSENSKLINALKSIVI